ncbi:hypothetical protein N0O92_13200 [Alkalihalobacillus sp. MEB130]|uniref:hypothetical protein n=1 Tax=Alkalihalobacillus sp. MEB130 TaxID=2976704 RepID=UPI0028DF9F25|nr:hypothetical protein [Alkalihalobacillus sp. MEB130]MDT8861192.1 hypothetical protein [Alkalihalobacillus sp. MEB130]
MSSLFVHQSSSNSLFTVLLFALHIPIIHNEHNKERKMNKKKWIVVAAIIGFIVVNMFITNVSNKNDDRDSNVNPINSNISTH